MKEKGRVFVWTLFDFANTSFSIIVVTFLYAVYFKKTVAGNEAIGDLYWSISHKHRNDHHRVHLASAWCNCRL
ncbi:MAG: hypothetical protein U5J96_08545 [Ignavibacteriaceae bacterium]|nr:hypothetical protein [Ignavibacteriaceae bacterium]